MALTREDLGRGSQPGRLPPVDGVEFAQDIADVGLDCVDRQRHLAGLGRDAALEGITFHTPGNELRIGEIAAGKVANLTIMTGDFTEEKSKVKLLFIDGKKIDPEREPAKPAPPAAIPFDDEEEGGVR